MNKKSSPPALSAKKSFSAKTRAIIEHRVESTRWPIFKEILSVVGSRAGEINDRQIAVTGSLVAQLVGFDDVARNLVSALTEIGVAPGRVENWLASAAGAELLARAAADRQHHLMVMRPDYTVAQIVAAFAITDDEQENLDLRLLISERRRSMLRRRAEAAPTGTEQRNTEQKPWDALGISKSTYYDRLKREAVKAGVRAAGKEKSRTAEPWKALGISRATWYRRDKDSGETDGRTETNPTPMSYNYSFSWTVASSPDSRLTPEHPPLSLYNTAEGRRFRAKAIRLGMKYYRGNDTNILTAWQLPPGQTLSDADNESFRQARLEADAAELRWLSRQSAKQREMMQEQAAKDGISYDELLSRLRLREKEAEAEEYAAILRGEKPPAADVPLEGWRAVPVNHRERVIRFAQVLFVSRSCSRAQAIIWATEYHCRPDAIWHVLRSVRPLINLKTARTLCRREEYWMLPTQEAAEKIAEKVGAAPESDDEAVRLSQISSVWGKAVVVR